MSYKSYKDLIVYKKSKQLSIDIIKELSKSGHPSAYKFIILQLMKPVSSVGASIAEGYGRHFKKVIDNSLVLQEVRALKQNIG